MTPDEVAVVLAKAALVDMRTIGEEEVMAWHEIVHRIELAAALAAVPRHYAETRERLMPADLLRHSRTVRDERRRLEAAHPVRALPGRYEDDVARDVRMERGLAACKDVLARIAEQLAQRRQTTAPEVEDAA